MGHLQGVAPRGHLQRDSEPNAASCKVIGRFFWIRDSPSYQAVPTSPSGKRPNRCNEVVLPFAYDCDRLLHAGRADERAMSFGASCVKRRGYNLV